MKMLSERGFNIHMFPMIQRRGRVFEGDYIKKNSKGETIFIAKEGSRWNLRCYKFMDWLSTKIRKRFDDNIMKLNPEIGLVTNMLDPRLSSYILTTRPDDIYFILDAIRGKDNGYGHLAQNYNFPFIVDYRIAAKELGWEKQHVKKIINMIYKCKFKTKYEIKSIKLQERAKPNFKYAYSNLEYDYETLFNQSMETINQKTFMNEIDLNKCTLKFDTGFGLCFLQNIFSGGYQLINDDLYNLSESAQMIYRQRFFTYNKIPGTFLTLNWVKNYLYINAKNKHEVKKLFKKIILELESIDGIEINRKVNDESYKISKGIKREQKILQFKK